MPEPLLVCELHAHTTWSDGTMSLRELVDLHGRVGVDVLCVTDHAVRRDDPTPHVDEATWHHIAYEFDREINRAWLTYGLLLIPGLELTDNRENPDHSAHALAIGLRQFVSVDEGIVPAIHAARAEGAAIVAAHPYGSRDLTPNRPTYRFAREPQLFRTLVDRWELFNRREVFPWVAEHSLSPVATGDVHRAEHLSSWKTLLRSAKDEEAVVACLRSEARAYLAPFAATQTSVPAVAA